MITEKWLVMKNDNQQKELDYKNLFGSIPDLYLLIAPDAPRFTLLDANKAHMQQTKLKKKDFVGKPFFEVWPDTTEKFKQTGVSDVAQSLTTVLNTKKPHAMGIIRYDIKDKNGQLTVRYWQPTHFPVLGEDGSIAYIAQTNREVTEQVGIEKKLERTQVQLNEALSAGLVGTWYWDIATDKVYADKSLSSMFNIDPEESANGLPLEVFIASIHPEDRDKVAAQIATALEESEEYEIEYRTIGAGGDIRWVIARGQIDRDKSGKPVRFPGVIVDITERKKIEESLEQSQAQLKFMAESMPQKVFTVTPAGVVDYYNPQWLQFTGLTDKDLTNDGWKQIVHPDDYERVARLWQKGLQTGESCEFECRFRRADGEYRWHLTRMHVMHGKNDQIIKWVGSNTDISEKKQEEINLKFLSEASKVFSSSLDYDTTLKKVASLAVPDIADWCAVDMLDETEGLKQVAVAHKDPAQVKWAAEFRKNVPLDMNSPTGPPQVIRTGKSELYPVITEDMLEALIPDKKALAKVNELGLCSMIVVPLKVEGKTIGTINFVSAEHKRSFGRGDLMVAEELAFRASLAMTNAALYRSAQEEIAYRERLEDELRQLNELLESRIAERTKQLHETNRSLERSNRELQDFAYVASHDLQEPLRKIQAFGDLLDEEYGSVLGEGKDYLERMRSAASRMSILITELLAFSRITTKARPFTLVDLRVIAE